MEAALTDSDPRTIWVPTEFWGVAHLDQVIGDMLEEMELQADR